MTVKVVSEGPVKTKRVTCHHCAYELEFTGEDVTRHTDCDGDSWQTIVCPRETCKDVVLGRTVINVKWP